MANCKREMGDTPYNMHIFWPSPQNLRVFLTRVVTMLWHRIHGKLCHIGSDHVQIYLKDMQKIMQNEREMNQKDFY
jgi:hypothetical protein